VSRGLVSTAAALAIVASSAGTAPAALATVSAPRVAAPAKASVRVYLPDAFFVGHQAVTVPNRTVHVGGVVRPYAPGQWVTVKAFLGRRLIKSARVRLTRSHDGAYGHFSEAISSPGVGSVVIRVGHSRTSTMRSFLSHRSIAALGESIGFGSTGRFVQLIQQRLAALHFYIPQTGVYDQGTGLAIDAYHRLLHWGTYQTLDGRTISFLLDGFGGFPVRDPRDGKHAEGNLGLQLLALTYGSQVYRIYPISSGKPSTPTILGHFRVYSKVPGYLPDGMYFSNFFYGGFAIHGYDPAPDYPASHGCMRLPITDALSVYDWLDYGDAVDVYY
jgi:L,D-transpeptidase catalytic domain